ncbi:Isopentenyl-diphosphate delta-isomerase 1 [Giardia lamblia P15]|uniref:isopentenyl-diphosphate Delta-isomerase n=1 Tax=Giardia intestinalis (strain P15) TaxID=658858 RepID=E1EYD1_GIAIA|nr:Isopentenyl-diphosphate delta-isomerase 1 [Giardia lamblia P15]
MLSPQFKVHADSATDDVILVDEENNIIGKAPKFTAHTRGGLLHRAFSVVTIDSQNRILLQRRASIKASFPNMLSNTCCSHPLASIPSDAEGIAGVKRAACRRYQFELGLPIQHPEDTLSCVWIFRYKATSPVALSIQTLDGEEKVDLCEHEIDYVLLHVADSTQVALTNDVIKSAAYNKDEVSELLWANMVEIRARWEEITPWFRILFDRVLEPWLLDPSICLTKVEDDSVIINLV